MIMITPETQSADIGNKIMSLLSRASALQADIDATSAQFTNLSIATKLNAFPTAPLTTTGGLGVADVSPNVNNPIDLRTTNGALLNRAISATDIAGCLTGLQGISSAVKGQAVTSNGALASLIAKVS